MVVGTILLSKTNEYLTHEGKLPLRPKHDKALLGGLIEGHRVSEDGYKLLPPSLQALCWVNTGNYAETPITIRELNECELLIVSRSTTDTVGGREFRLDNFKLLLKDRKIELWIRKYYV